MIPLQTRLAKEHCMGCEGTVKYNEMWDIPVGTKKRIYGSEYVRGHTRKGEEMRNSGAIWRFVAILVIGLGLLGYFAYDSLPYLSDPVDISTMNPDDFDTRQHVKMDVTSSIGYCSSTITTTTTRTGATKSKKETERIYCVPVYDNYNGYYYPRTWLLISVGSTNFNMMEDITNNTWDWWDYDYENYGAPYGYSDTDYSKLDTYMLPLDGYTKKTDSETIGFAREAFEGIGMTSEDFEDMVVYQYVITPQNGTMKIIAIIGIVLLVIGLIGTIVCIKKGKKDNEDTGINNSYNGGYQQAYGAGNTYAGGYDGQQGMNYNAGGQQPQGMNYNPNGQQPQGMNYNPNGQQSVNTTDAPLPPIGGSDNSNNVQ